MKDTTEHVEFEQKFFSWLMSVFPLINIDGHILVVHTGKWWVCNVFTGPEVGLEKFKVIVHEVERELPSVNMWGHEICHPHNHATGIDTLGRHYYTAWLPVYPARSSDDFAKFYPG
jgi:hypothetical protein